MKIVKLAEVVKQLESGSRPKGGVSSETGKIPSLGAEHLSETGQIEFKNKKFVNEDFYKKLRNGKVIPNDILIVKDGATTGKVAILSRSFPYKNVAINEHVFKISINEKIAYPLFIYCFLKSTYGKKQILNDFRGATVGGISRQFVDLVKIPLPPLDDQKRIAHLLGKVEGMIARRKQHLQQLDELLKSVFLEMFGDPVRNEKGWEKKPLLKMGYLDRGVSKHRPRNAPELLGGTYPLIQTGDVTNSGIYITEYKQTYSKIGFAQSKLWPTGTLCITIAANIAQTSILTFDSCFPDSVVGFTSKENESHPLFVLGLFWFFQQILEKNAPAAAQKNINLKILRELEVPAPPITLQNQFAAIVEKVESLKSRYQSSLSNLENLYGALSQKAFKGELDLSRVPMEEEAR